jgi:hypothetical protein
VATHSGWYLRIFNVRFVSLLELECKFSKLQFRSFVNSEEQYKGFIKIPSPICLNFSAIWKSGSCDLSIVIDENVTRDNDCT